MLVCSGSKPDPKDEVAGEGERERRLRYSDQETKVLDGSVDRYTGGDGGNEWLNKSKGKEDVGQGQDGSLYI